MAKRYRSSIPASAIERVVSPYHREGGAVWLRKSKCFVGRTLVGERFYDHDGTLLIETPLRRGQKHGIEFHWYEGGESLETAEPFYEGLPHGLASQWDADGTLLGTYTLNRGTGLDLWRGRACSGGSVYLSEVHSMKDGYPHGYEWWLNEDQLSVFIERHWHEGQLHGVEREWNAKEQLRRGYPKYHIRGIQVNKRAYFIACQTDPSLPAFHSEDNKPVRCFPSDIARELGSRSS